MTVGGSPFAVSPVSVTLAADEATARLTGLTTEQDNAEANGTGTNRVRAVVADAHGNPVPGISVSFSATHGATVVPQASTEEDGSVSVTLTSLTAGTATVTASVNETSTTVDVHFKMVVPVDATSSLTATPNIIKPNGVDQAVVSWAMKDKYGNPISGRSNVGFNINEASGVLLGAVTESPSGTYTATLKGTVSQVVTIKPTLDGTINGSLGTTVTLPTEMSATTKLVAPGNIQFSKNSGFPKTGIIGVQFQVLIDGDTSKSASYTWSSNQSWANVNTTGMVSFSGTPNSTTKNVAIIARPKTSGAPLVFYFTLAKWFTIPGEQGSVAQAYAYCSQSGLGEVPSRPEITNTTVVNADGIRGNDIGVGILWPEWGNGITSIPIVLSSSIESSINQAVRIPMNGRYILSNNAYFICRKNL